MDFEELLRKNLVGVNNVCRMVAHKFYMQPKDLQQDVLEKVWKYRDTYEHKDDKSFLNWASFIARNVAIDEYRKKVKRGVKVDIDSAFAVGRIDNDYGNIDLLIRVRQVISQKFPRWIEVMELLSEGYKYEEIAEKTGIPLNTLKGVIARVRREIIEQRDNMDGVPVIQDIAESKTMPPQRVKVLASLPVPPPVTKPKKVKATDMDRVLAERIMEADMKVLIRRFLEERCLNCGRERPSGSLSGALCRHCFRVTNVIIKREIRKFRHELWLTEIRLDRPLLKINDERRKYA